MFHPPLYPSVPRPQEDDDDVNREYGNTFYIPMLRFHGTVSSEIWKSGFRIWLDTDQDSSHVIRPGQYQIMKLGLLHNYSVLHTEYNVHDTPRINLTSARDEMPGQLKRPIMFHPQCLVSLNNAFDSIVPGTVAHLLKGSPGSPLSRVV